MKKLYTLLFLLGCFQAFISNAQHLTISNTGETGTSGTNWSITGNELASASGTANIHPSVITNHLQNNGNLTISMGGAATGQRNLIIDGAINYTGSNARTLTIKSRNDLTMSTGSSITSTNAALNVVLRSASATASPMHGIISLTNATINTNGGHLWLAGGNADVQWNGLTVGDHYARTYSDDVKGLEILGSTLTTNGGHLYLAGYSYNSVNTSGNNTGLDIDNSTLSTTTGNIEIDGYVNGLYNTGAGARIDARTGPINILTTTGNIIIDSYGTDAAGTGTGWRHGLVIYSANSTNPTTIKTVSGNITITGTAAHNNSTVNDAEGLAMGGTNVNGLSIVSQTGQIQLNGSNTRANTGQYCNGIRFYTSDIVKGIVIGDDGVNTYSGNISINADAILQRYISTLSGNISIKTTGTITIQPQSNSFTYFRAGNSGILTFDNDWDFGTTATAINIGKSTNTFGYSISNAITANGPINIYGGALGLNAALTSTALTAKSTGTITVGGNLTSNGGNIVLWSDSDNSGAGGILVNDNVTIDSRTEADRNANTHTTGGGHIILAGGLDDAGVAAGTNSLTSGLLANDNLPDGYAVNSGSTAAQCGIAVGTATSASGHNANVNIFSGSGNIRFCGLATTTISGGGPDGLLFYQGHTFNAGTNGNITLIGNSNSGTYGMGMDLAAWRSTNYSATSTMTTVNGNISIIGRSANSTSGNWGIMIDGEGNNRHIFMTNSGNITFNGMATGLTAQLDMRFTNVDVLSNSGNINFLAQGAATGFSVGNYNIGNGLFLGQKAGSAVTSSSSNITVSTNKLDLTNKPLAIATSGNVVVEPFAMSFTTSPVWSSTNFTVSGNPSNIRIGKDGNATAFTIPSTLSANGPISLYGGALTLNANLSSTNAGTGDILIKGSTLAGTGAITIANGKNLTLNLSSNSTFANAINGTNANLIKEGAGTLTLSASTAYSGSTTINGGALQFNENKTFTDLTIASGTTFVLPTTKQYTVNGTLTNNGTLTIESGATLVQGASSTLSGSGTYNVLQAITGAGSSTPTGRYWYLGSPVSTASSSVFFGNTANVVKKRDEATNAWLALTSGAPENLVVGKGYYTQAMANSTLTFTGGSMNNGSVTISGLTRTTGQNSEGFNLVSNPYPSYLDWDAVTKTDVGNTMWYRTASGSTAASMVFETYVAGAAGGIGTNLSGNTATKLIPPMQAFWVRVNSGSSTGSLSIDNSMRAHFTSLSGSTAGLRSTNDELKLFLRMNLLQADKKDQIIVYVNDNATNGFDILDGEKMMQAGSPQFYTSAAGKKITINGLNSAKKQQALPITMELPTTGVHSFVIEDLEISNGLVWLEDKQEEIIQALEPGTVYEFFANSGINAERFVLHFQLIDDATPVNVYNEVNSSANFSGKGASVYAEAAGVVVIKLPTTTEGVTDIQIRDAAGKLVYSGSTNTLETSVQLEQANGIYYVTLNSTSGVEVRKVFVQQ